MRNDECPICRKKFQGKCITKKILSRIYQKKILDKKERESELNLNFIYEIEDDFSDLFIILTSYNGIVFGH